MVWILHVLLWWVHHRHCWHGVWRPVFPVPVWHPGQPPLSVCNVNLVCTQ